MRYRVCCVAAVCSALVVGCARDATAPRLLPVYVAAHEDSVPGVSLFLADGIAEEIGDALARTPGLRTVMQRREPVSVATDTVRAGARGDRVAPRDGPTYTLTLSAAYAWGRDTISTPLRVRLVSILTTPDTAGAPRHAWKDSVEFPLDAFAAERRRIVQDVTQHTGASRAASSAMDDSAMGTETRDATTWLEAFQGWRALHAGGRDNMEIAFLHFKRALAGDSTFARAYLGLALASAEYVDMQTGANAIGAADVALRIAARAVQRARALDSGLVDAQVLAAALLIRNANTFEADIARALARNAGSAAAATMVASTSRDAIGALRSVIALDSMRAGSYAALALAGIEAGNAEISESGSAEAIRLAPGNLRWRALQMLARVMRGNYAGAHADCVVFAGSDAMCAKLWSDSTDAEARAIILHAAYARSSGGSDGTTVVPTIEAVLWPQPSTARASDSASSATTSAAASRNERLDNQANRMTFRAMRTAESVPPTSYPLTILLAQRTWGSRFRADVAWLTYVRTHAGAARAR